MALIGNRLQDAFAVMPYNLHPVSADLILEMSSVVEIPSV
jgi:hypothetical protein